jgi:GrpB-like predicted nucleotidyltransferase (UPF0157 family)
MKTPAEKFGAGPIIIAEYDSAWPGMFDREREAVRAALGKLVLKVEHIGSTAIPGLPAKPIIDLLVGIRSLAEARARAIEPLVQLGYVYIPEYESWLPDELFFRKGVPGPWTRGRQWPMPISRNRSRDSSARTLALTGTQRTLSFATCSRAHAVSDEAR